MTTTRTHRWLAGSGAALALVALTGLGCSDESANPPMDDIGAPWTCSTDADGTVRARGTVTNHSSKASFYVITVDFSVDGRSFESTTETVDDVRPGETVDVESAVTAAPAGDPGCVVTDVDRFKA